MPEPNPNPNQNAKENVCGKYIYHIQGQPVPAVGEDQIAIAVPATDFFKIKLLEGIYKELRRNK